MYRSTNKKHHFSKTFFVVFKKATDLFLQKSKKALYMNKQQQNSSTLIIGIKNVPAAACSIDTTIHQQHPSVGETMGYSPGRGSQDDTTVLSGAYNQ